LVQISYIFISIFGMFKLELSFFVPYLCGFFFLTLQAQANILGIINILLNSRTQIKNVQLQMDLVIYLLTTKSPRLHCWHSNVSSIAFAFKKTSRSVENHKRQEVMIHIIFLIFQKFLKIMNNKPIEIDIIV